MAALEVKGEVSSLEHKAAKYGFWGTVVAALISGAVALYVHFDGPGVSKKIVDIQKKANNSKDTANLTVSDIYVPPINTSIDSAFFLKIDNDSLVDAKNVKVEINFGDSSVKRCETAPVNFLKSLHEFDTSIVEFSAGDIQKDDSLYVYCMISNPVFDSILIKGSNLYGNVLYSFKDYSKSKGEGESGFTTFFKFIGSLVAVIFIGYFTFMSIISLNRKFGVDSKNR